jgi:hypothetical protein
MLTGGMLAAVLVDAALAGGGGAAGRSAAGGGGGGAWRWMVGLPAVPGALMAAAVALLPESPR